MPTPAWRRANPEKNKAQRARYAAKHKDQRLAQGRKRYQKNRERILARQKAYAAQPEVKALREEARLLRAYNLTADMHRTLLVAQNNACAICGAMFLGGSGSTVAHVDHDHATGRVRGILCENCNRGLGMLRDSPALLRRAAEYLDQTTHDLNAVKRS